MQRTKVLLIDDEAEFVTALAERLQLRNYDATAVFCADDAFSAFLKNPPDVVLLDLKMPGMDGIEVLKTLKLYDPAVEVIILTGLGAEQSGNEGIRRGAFDYVVKPVDIDDLTVKIDQAKKKKDKE